VTKLDRIRNEVIRQRVHVQLESRGEERINIQNEKIWEDREIWKRLCSVIHYSKNA
jgi:hypothetical protein